MIELCKFEKYTGLVVKRGILCVLLMMKIICRAILAEVDNGPSWKERIRNDKMCSFKATILKKYEQMSDEERRTFESKIDVVRFHQREFDDLFNKPDYHGKDKDIDDFVNDVVDDVILSMIW